MVIPELAKFRAQYPDISIVLGVNDQPIDLIANSVDCVLRLGTLPVSSMIGRKIADIPMVICASPEYLKRNGIPSSIESLMIIRSLITSQDKSTYPSWHFPMQVMKKK
ncbi:LysR substrate-binding domain-containing protein [Acinetobacter baumannii]